MSSVNKAILVGRIGNLKDLAYTGANTAVKEFSMATSKKIKGDERTTWHNVVLWGKAAEALDQYLTKGKMVYVEGEIDNQTYEKKDGTKGYISKINSFSIQLLSGNDKQDEKQQEQDRKDSSFTADDIPF